MFNRYISSVTLPLFSRLRSLSCLFSMEYLMHTWLRLSSTMASRNTATWMAFMPQVLEVRQLPAPRLLDGNGWTRYIENYPCCKSSSRPKWLVESWSHESHEASKYIIRIIIYLNHLSTRPSARVCSSEARSSMRYLLIRVYLGIGARTSGNMSTLWGHNETMATYC